MLAAPGQDLTPCHLVRLRPARPVPPRRHLLHRLSAPRSRDARAYSSRHAAMSVHRPLDAAADLVDDLDPRPPEQLVGRATDQQVATLAVVLSARAAASHYPGSGP